MRDGNRKFSDIPPWNPKDTHPEFPKKGRQVEGRKRVKYPRNLKDNPKNG